MPMSCNFYFYLQKNVFVFSCGIQVPFNCALRVVMENLKDKIICSEQDLVGVFFLGTKEKDTQSSFEHVYKFIEMGNPTATGIRSLQVFYCHHFSFCCAILVAFSQHHFEHPSGTFLYLGNS